MLGQGLSANHEHSRGNRLSQRRVMRQSHMTRHPQTPDPSKPQNPYSTKPAHRSNPAPVLRPEIAPSINISMLKAFTALPRFPEGTLESFTLPPRRQLSTTNAFYELLNQDQFAAQIVQASRHFLLRNRPAMAHGPRKTFRQPRLPKIL
jgi:hypothetical protein